MRSSVALLGLAAMLALAGCTEQPRMSMPEASPSRYSAPTPNRSTTGPADRSPTTPMSQTNTCTTAAQGRAGNELVSATLTRDANRIVATYEFERPYTLHSGEPNSVGIRRPDRILLEAGPVYAWVLLSADQENEAISYVVRDSPVGGKVIPGASLEANGNQLTFAVPLPLDLSRFADQPAKWSVEALGVGCPGSSASPDSWLLTDVLLAAD